MNESNSSAALETLRNSIDRLLEELQTVQDRTVINSALKNSFMKAWPGFAYKPVSNENEQPMCAVCLCKYELDDNLWKLPCKHDFHVSCLYECLKVKDACPICRASVFNLY